MVFESMLAIRTLGCCCITYGEKVISDETIGSRKFWTALEYLVLNRERPITQTELISVLYPGGDSFNPGNALKTLIHRIRCALDTLEYIDGRKLILNVRGAYKWNTNIVHNYDLECFENLCEKSNAPDLSEDERLSFLLAAIDIYKGNYLPRLKLEVWASEVNIKYYAMFTYVLNSTITLLENKGEFERIISICRHALTIDPYDEHLYYCIIHSMVELGNNSEALKEYNSMSDLFYKQFGISPSNELKKLYREIIRSVKNAESDLSLIQEDLNEVSLKPGAFFCEYETFKDIYRLEVRSSSRNGGPVHLGHISLETKPGSTPSLKTLNYYMEKLSDCISSSLRRGDVFSKYSISQFITLLPTNTCESALSVMTRISKQFHRDNPRAPFTTGFSVRAMELMIG